MFKDLEAAKAFVRENAQMVEGVQQDHFTFAKIRLPYVEDGKVMNYTACGFSKYNAGDAKQGMPFSLKQGREIAINRAVTVIAEALMVDQRTHVFGSLVDKILGEMRIGAKAG